MVVEIPQRLQESQGSDTDDDLSKFPSDFAFFAM